MNLAAWRKGDTAFVEVNDDGRGLNAYMVIDLDAELYPHTLESISRMENFNRLCFVDNA